jgi:hypothetical protein
LRLLREVPEAVRQRAVNLVQPGGLVKYPIGRGGILLNQLDIAESAAGKTGKGVANIAANLGRKQAIWGSLLRNLGAALEVVAPDPGTPAGRR